ncbi:DUF6544 family protein [Rhizomonospora bruguierae]|uniref:DUF6544 family protein n=1 Tax=Rhizomonospora bruguierae TaxID=1581705 RepID=UPI001BCBCB9D|nr:DUF6544 family protein [Micromonospora sp. NBRC 107566]
MPSLAISPMDVRLLDAAPTDVFTDAEVAGVPEPVRRYLRAAITSGTRLAHAARLTMTGRIRLGVGWVPFRAAELLSPHRGFRFGARVGGLITGSEAYADGWGQVHWSLLGLPIVNAFGPDVARGNAGRAAAEACWVPTALLPRYGVRWTADDDHHLRAAFPIDGLACDVRLTVDDEARVTAVRLARWGDPDGTGTWGWHRFGLDVTGYASFGGLTVPAVGIAGWHPDTDRWDRGAFLQCHLTALDPVT